MQPYKILLIFLFGVVCCPLGAQSFSFYSTLRAGRPNSGDWQLGVGNSVGVGSSNQYFYYDAPSNQHWRSGGLTQKFEIGWNAATNTAYTSVYDVNGNASTASYANPGSTLSKATIWTLPAASFYASAAGITGPTSINLEGLTFSPGVTFISGSLPASIGASQNSGSITVLNSLSAPIVLSAAGSGGSWYVSGTVRFSGLVSQGGNATGSRLQFFLTASGSDVPEASSMAMVGTGLVAMALVQAKTKSRSKKG